MAARPQLTQTEVDRLPMNTIITLGGMRIHTGWFGGLEGTFRNARYGFARDYSGNEYFEQTEMDPDGNPVTKFHYESGNLLEDQYIVANSNSVTVPVLTDLLVRDRWKFFSSRGLDDIRSIDPVPMNSVDLEQDPYGSYRPWASPWQPAMQHYPFCAMTNTRRSDGRYAVYQESETTELGSDLAFLNGSGTLIFVIDGTGSFGGGRRAISYMTDVLNTYRNIVGNSTRLIVTKFSDDYMVEGDFFDGVVIGDYSSITANTITAASERITAFNTGNGGDTNETQLMGIYVGMERVKNVPGPKAIVVYTDAAAVCPMPSSLTVPALKQRHRDDGLTTDSRQEKGRGSSLQTSIRRGSRTYY